MKRLSQNKFVSNVLLSVGVQIISLAVSFILNLILPKFIDEYQYSYWQSYVLYVNYVGILHFGLLDGIVLRYAQYDYDQLDKPKLRSQFYILLTLISTAASIGFLVSSWLQGVSSIVLVLVSVGTISKNLFTYTSYTFQITNRIEKYAIITIVQRGLYGLGVAALLLLGVKNFFWFCLFDLLGDIFAFLLGLLFNKDIYLGKGLGIKVAFQEAKHNIRSGALLLVSNWFSILTVGSAKMVVQWRWDELLFGKISFSFSISNLFLTFIAAVSVVLFPTLKRLEKSQLPNIYKSIRGTISPLLFYAMLLFFPGCWILAKWLPAYQPSLEYLGILLPIIIYTSKVSLLTNNYLKAYRKEKAMFVINIASACLAFMLFVISAFVLNNLWLLLISVVLVMMFGSIASEVVVMKIINMKFISDFVIEAIMTVLFIICANMFELWIGCLIYAIILVGYSIYYRKDLKSILHQISRFLPRQHGA